jgi:hypothetical protein
MKNLMASVCLQDDSGALTTIGKRDIYPSPFLTQQQNAQWLLINYTLALFDLNGIFKALASAITSAKACLHCQSISAFSPLFFHA